MEACLSNYILEEFDSAIEHGYIQIYYQPVIRTVSGQLCSFEALARWVDPVRGILGPNQFIPVLEQNNRIHELDCYVIEQACRRFRHVVEAGGIPVPVSVNLSRLDFALCDIFEAVNQAVSTYQVPHDFLYIEITESMLGEDEKLSHEVVRRFREAGFQVWMDDFGSGYSSLNMLKDFQFNELKLDLRFLSSFSDRSRWILTSVIQMAKEIDIHTLAEGVETEEQFQYLRNIGCEKVQGYFFGRPLPYDEITAHLNEKGIQTEIPLHRKYYDEIGRINFLSSAPFLNQSKRVRQDAGRHLNSIPLALLELRQESFSILMCNAAFEQSVSGVDSLPDIFHAEQLGVNYPLSVIPVRMLNVMKNTRQQNEGRSIFVSNDDYYELITKCVARRPDAFCVLVQLNNLSQSEKVSLSSDLDEGLRQIYSFFDRIAIFDLNQGTITPLYMGMLDYLIDSACDLNTAIHDFAEKWIFPEDQESYLQMWDLPTLEKRIKGTGSNSISGYYRYRMTGGRYNWKQTVIMAHRPGIVIELVHNAHQELKQFNPYHSAVSDNSQKYSPQLLWENLVRSDVVRLFWKDQDRRFLGVNRGFLNYYGFSSAKDLIGKNDEELGWHVHPDLYMNDELRVIREGVTLHNMPGRCICKGENREILANKTPLYSDTGDIIGLIGSFLDREMLADNDIRGTDTTIRDELTGLLNSRGLFEHLHAFQDEYFLRNTDFVRLHVAIDDLSSINRQYGFDFGDRVISALGEQLQKAFGMSSAVGRINGFQFVVIHQIRSGSELSELRSSIRRIASDIKEVDGTPITLYLSMGYALFSESEDLEVLAQNAEMRLLVDHDDHSPAHSLHSQSSNFFRLYDNLPIAYAVYKVHGSRKKKTAEAVLFYANHLYEKYVGVALPDMLGHSVSEIVPDIEDRWYELAVRSAIDGETIAETMHFTYNDRYFYITVNQIIRTGYCAFTYQELDCYGKPIDPTGSASR